jgi:hypothetical protein
MTRKVIFFDVDGVLLDMMGPFARDYMNGMDPNKFEQYGIHVYPPFNGDVLKMAEAFKTMIETPVYGNLEPLCVMTSLEALKAMGFELQVITQSSGTTNARTNRVWNLVKKFGPVFSGVHFTVYKQSKLEYINKWAGDNLSGADHVVALVEDKPETVLEVLDWKVRKDASRHIRGMRAIGIKQTYNKDTWEHPDTLWYPGVDSFAFSMVYHTIEKQDK